MALSTPTPQHKKAAPRAAHCGPIARQIEGWGSPQTVMRGLHPSGLDQAWIMLRIAPSSFEHAESVAPRSQPVASSVQSDGRIVPLAVANADDTGNLRYGDQSIVSVTGVRARQDGLRDFLRLIVRAKDQQNRLADAVRVPCFGEFVTGPHSAGVTMGP